MNKHYYIPTSSLNLETILQSESISPYSFYPQRISGSTIFELLPEYANCKNAVILLNRPIHFFINDPERYNFPMLIEVSDDVQLNSETLKEVVPGVYACGTTINLTPANCRFIFFERRHYNIATITVRDSRAVKYYNEYSIIDEWCCTNEDLQLVDDNTLDGVSLSAENNEIRIDKMKGFLYANLLGQMKSLSPDLARLRRLSQEIYNIMVALQSSPDSFCNYRDKLSKLVGEYREIEPEAKRCRESFEKKWNDGIVKALNLHSSWNFLGKKIWEFIKEEMLIKFGVFDLCEVNYAKSNALQPLTSIDTLQTVADFQEYCSEIMRRYNTAVDEYRKIQPNITLGAIKLGGDTLEIENARYINAVVAFIIKNNITPDYLLANTPKLCIDIVKNIIQPEYERRFGVGSWDKSDVQQYFLSLYYYIAQNGERFDVHSIKDEELQAIAAFIYAGRDLSYLYTYIKMNEIHNCTYAISLWGVLCGYMDMPKDVLQSLLTIDIYKAVYLKMYGYEVKGVQFDVLPREDLPMYKRAINSLDARGIAHTKDDDDKLRYAAVLEHNKRSPEALLRLLDNVLLPQHKKEYQKLKSLLETDGVVLPNNDQEICDFLIENAQIEFSNKGKQTKEFKMAQFKAKLLECIAKENLQNDCRAMVEIADDDFPKKGEIIESLRKDLTNPEESGQLSIFST